jgi:molecular chaperone GrpE
MSKNHQASANGSNQKETEEPQVHNIDEPIQAEDVKTDSSEADESFSGVAKSDDKKDAEVLTENLLKDKEKELLYLRAEFENYKRQSLKERSELLKYSGEFMARDLLNSLDIFEKALTQDVDETNYKNFVEGINLTANQLKADLKKHGIEEIDCKGKVFDPNTCEALSQIPSADHKEGEVMEVMRKGFVFKDKVIRYAQVVIATKAD